MIRGDRHGTLTAEAFRRAGHIPIAHRAPMSSLPTCQSAMPGDSEVSLRIRIRIGEGKDIAAWTDNVSEPGD